MHTVGSVVSVGAIHIETHHDVLVCIAREVVFKSGGMRCEAFNFGISTCVVSPSFKFGPRQAMVGRDERKDTCVVLRARGNWRQEARGLGKGHIEAEHVVLSIEVHDRRHQPEGMVRVPNVGPGMG